MVSREELYELVWSKPMTKVDEEFEVSGSYMARVCTILNVPRPERGYWSKLAVGKAPARVPLPEAQPGDQLSWSNDGELRARPSPRPQCPPKRQAPARIRVPKGRVHGVIRGARQHFESGRPIEDGAYLKPYKKLLVDVTASKACLDKALGFANDLFNALESVGHRVMLAPAGEHLAREEIDEREVVPNKRREYRYSNLWSPWRPTVVYVGTVAIGLAIVEMSEDVLLRYIGNGKYIRDADYSPPRNSRYRADHTWTTTRSIPSGRLRLVAYAPYHRVSWSTTWQETKKSTLGSAVKTIVKTIEDSAPGIVEKLEEARRKAEIARLEFLAAEERRRKEEDRRRVEQSVRDSLLCGRSSHCTGRRGRDLLPSLVSGN